MGTVNKRTTIHDDGQPTTDNVIIASSTTSVDEKEEGVSEIPVFVPPGSGSLLVAVTGPENAPAAEPPRGVTEVTLVAEEGGVAVPVAPDNAKGGAVYVVDNPKPGRWRVIVRHVKESAFVVRAVAMRDSALEYVREKWPTLRCGACKEGLQAAVAIAVGLLTNAVTGGAALAATSIAFIAERTRLPNYIIDYILKRMFGTTIDTLVEEVCERMEMCTSA